MSTSAAVAEPSRARRIVGWILRVLLAFAFLGAGAMKLTGAEAMITLFEDIGAGQWMRYFVGVCEVAGAIGLLVPRVHRLAAACLVLLMIGAAITDLFIVHASPVGSISLGVLSAVLLLVSRPTATHPS